VHDFDDHVTEGADNLSRHRKKVQMTRTECGERAFFAVGPFVRVNKID